MLSFSISRARIGLRPLLRPIAVSYVVARYLIRLPSLPPDLVHCPSLIESTLTLCQKHHIMLSFSSAASFTGSTMTPWIRLRMSTRIAAHHRADSVAYFANVNFNGAPGYVLVVIEPCCLQI